METLGISAYAPQVHVDLARAAQALRDEDGYDRGLLTAHRLFLQAGAPARAEEVLSLVESY